MKDSEVKVKGLNGILHDVEMKALLREKKDGGNVHCCVEAVITATRMYTNHT